MNTSGLANEVFQGKLALHEIIVEKDLVSYWDKFLAIAFDNSQKAMLTTCSLKNPELPAPDPEIKCCFSFTIRRDNHNMYDCRIILDRTVLMAKIALHL